MPPGQVLANFGLFVKPDFLDADARQDLTDEIRSSTVTADATIVSEARGTKLDTQARKTRNVKVSRDAQQVVAERLQALIPELEKHFGVQLKGFQAPSFLTYREGDYFHAHKDGDAHNDDVPEHIRERKVSVVMFVNSEAADPGDEVFGGGSLVFYGLMGGGRGEGIGIPLNGTRGELVAFPSDVMHEVKPVTHGERHTIVSWFV
jgi:SM-20-related protein